MNGWLGGANQHKTQGRVCAADGTSLVCCCKRGWPWVFLFAHKSIRSHSACTHSPPPPIQTTKQHRLDKVRELRWETGGAVIPAHLQRKLSAKEAEFFASYDKLLSEYMGHYPLLDLTGSTLVRTESLWNARPGWGS